MGGIAGRPVAGIGSCMDSMFCNVFGARAGIGMIHGAWG